MIEKIKEYIVNGLSNSGEWINVLNRTNPGHFGLVEWHVSISKAHVFIDIPNRVFVIKDVQYDFMLQLRDPSEEDGFKKWFTRIVTGKGFFYLEEKTEKVTIETLNINMDLDLYSREEHLI